jgi:hypothetical protein
MIGFVMFVGGEFYYDREWMGQGGLSIGGENGYFLNGGIACLTAIGDFLRDHGIERILLPAYLCPSIPTTFERSGIAWDYYPVKEDLSIDVERLADKLASFKAVYFINYFGFLHNETTRNFFKQIRQNGMLVIEDNAQAGFHDHPIGDFILNSLRKLTPYDGGYLITRQDMAPYFEKYQGYVNRRLPLIRAYREGLYHYLYEGVGNYDELEDLFTCATHVYETDVVVVGDEDERRQIESLDWQGIKQIRRENFSYMMNWVNAIPEITPIYRELQADNMPFGLPIYFSEGLRDRVNEELGKASISLVIHWEDICSDARTRQNRMAVDMASRMLTLAIDQRISHKQMDYLAMKLIHSIAAVKAS